MILEILKMTGIILVGFIITEIAAAYLGKQVKSIRPYFSIIGIEFNQKDAQRLLLSVFLGVAIMITLPYIVEFTNFKINGYIAYLIVGISPTAVMFFVKKKFSEKTGIKESHLKSSISGHPDPDKEEK